MRKNILVMLIAVVVTALWGEYRTRVLVERALVEQEQREIAFWRERLVPVCRDFEVELPEHPATKAELFAPLLKLMELQERVR